MTSLSKVSTGINGLDEILNFLQMGDNVVFQVDEIADYKAFVKPYVKTSLAQKRDGGLYAFCQPSASFRSQQEHKSL